MPSLLYTDVHNFTDESDVYLTRKSEFKDFEHAELAIWVFINGQKIH